MGGEGGGSLGMRGVESLSYIGLALGRHHHQEDIFALMAFEAHFYDSKLLLMSTSLIVEGSQSVTFYDLLEQQWENSKILNHALPTGPLCINNTKHDKG